MSPLKQSALDVREAAWRDAYSAWWEAATAGDWETEHALRMAAADAWHDLPESLKRGAWVRWKLSRGEVPEPGTYSTDYENGG